MKNALPTPWNYCLAVDRLSTRIPESDLDMAASTAHPSVCILHFLPSVGSAARLPDKQLRTSCTLITAGPLTRDASFAGHTPLSHASDE
jgi:hypothetical protein